jgi:hypothetical protein
MLKRLFAPWRLHARVQVLAFELGKLICEQGALEGLVTEELEEIRLYMTRELLELRDKIAILERENRILTIAYAELVTRLDGVERTRSGTRERVP